MRVPECECPNCHKILDAASTPGTPDLQATPGDLSVCAYCGSFHEFDSDMKIVLFPDEKLFDIPDGLRLQMVRTRKAILQVCQAAEQAEQHPPQVEVVGMTQLPPEIAAILKDIFSRPD